VKLRAVPSAHAQLSQSCEVHHTFYHDTDRWICCCTEYRYTATEAPYKPNLLLQKCKIVIRWGRYCRKLVCRLSVCYVRALRYNGAVNFGLS
jgi:hypothetical protein